SRRRPGSNGCTTGTRRPARTPSRSARRTAPARSRPTSSRVPRPTGPAGTTPSGSASANGASAESGYSQAMPRRLFVFDLPDRFATGTVGEPGNRTFFLQARDGRRVVSVGLEKTQVVVLADRLGKLLVELDRRGIVEDPPTPIEPDETPLDEPLNEAFRATTLTLGWDGESERILIEARAPGDEDEVGEDEVVVELEDDDE